MTVLIDTSFVGAPDWDAGTDAHTDAAVGLAGDGISANERGNSPDPNGLWSTINASNASGFTLVPGAKAFRQAHWGDNQFGTEMHISHTGVSEFWFGFYFRANAGSVWDGTDPQYWKLIDSDSGDASRIIFGLQGSTGGKRAWGLFVQNMDTAFPSTLSYYASQGNSDAGSGNFNHYEWSVNRTAGTFKFWFDGVQYADVSGISFGPNAWDGWTFTGNQKLISTTVPIYTDVTAIKIVDSGGPIGPLAGAAPTKLSMSF